MRKVIQLEANSVVKDFSFDHATRLLRFEKERKLNNWKIVTKGYEFIDNEIRRIKKSNKTE